MRDITFIEKDFFIRGKASWQRESEYLRRNPMVRIHDISHATDLILLDREPRLLLEDFGFKWGDYKFPVPHLVCEMRAVLISQTIAKYFGKSAVDVPPSHVQEICISMHKAPLPDVKPRDEAQVMLTFWKVVREYITRA